MVDSVRFPPSIGGSGKTFTSDANPQTGVFNGGHRINFFPMLADTVAAAGYVGQYAQAIDGAKGNADRAENARGYVEAVADAYKVNIKDAYSDKTALGLNFARGKYLKDDGDLTETTNATDLLTVERATPKWVEGPNGKLREVPANTVAREWRNGVPQGALIESSVTNLLLRSEDFSISLWGKLRTVITSNTTEAPDGMLSADTLTEDLQNGEHYIEQNASSFPSSGTFTFSVFAKAGDYTQFRFRPVHTGANEGDTSNIIFTLEGQGDVGGFSVFDAVKSTSIKEMANGWYFCSATLQLTGNVTTLRHRIQLLSNEGSSTYQGDGESGIYIWGAQLEEAFTPSSYIPTTSAPVTRAADNVYREFNLSEFTLVADVKNIAPTGENNSLPIIKLNNVTDQSQRGISISASNTGEITGQFRTPDRAYISPLRRAAGVIAVSLSHTHFITAIGGVVQSEAISENDYISLRNQITHLFVRNYLQPIGGNGTPPAVFSVGYVDVYPSALTAAELEELTAS